MSRPSSPTLSYARALILTLLIAGAGIVALSSGHSTEGEWVQIIEGEPHTPRHSGPAGPPALDPRVDLTGVWVHEDPEYLYIRLATRDDPVPQTIAHDEVQIQTTLTFTLWSRSEHTQHLFDLVADDNGFRLLRGGSDITSEALNVPSDATPWDYEIGIRRDAALPDTLLELGDRITQAVAEAVSTYPALPPASDRAPGTGTGSDYQLRLASDGGVAPVWQIITGPDYAAAPSVATAPDDTIHVVYIVYNDERDTPKGLYHAVLKEQEQAEAEPLAETAPGLTLDAERVADAAMPEEVHQNDKTATALALDDRGRPHIVYHPTPDGRDPGTIRYALKADGKWTLEDPAATTQGPLPVTDAHWSVPDVVVGGDRAVVSFQSGDDVQLVERKGKGSWERLATLGDARFAKLELDSQGTLNVAWFHETHRREDDGVATGALRYATETDGFSPRSITTGIRDQSLFWETSATDGSFAFALDPHDRPHFVWDDGSNDRGYAILDDGTLRKEPSGLKPVHGNPQLRIRLAFDAQGTSHITSGYGGSDLYALRSTGGGWLKSDTERYDMFSLAVRSDGKAVVAHTQPHGGTTLALALQERPGLPGQADDNASEYQQDDNEQWLIPAPAPLLLVAALTGVLHRLRTPPGKASGRGSMPQARTKEPPRRRRALLVLFLAILITAGAAAIAPTTLGQEEEWQVLIEDQPLGATYDLPGAPPAADPRVDLETVHVQERAGAVWFRLQTRASGQGEEMDGLPPVENGVRYESQLEFRLTTGDPQKTHRVWIQAVDNEFRLHIDGGTYTGLVQQSDSVAWDYEVGVSKHLFGFHDPLRAGDKIHDAMASVTSSESTGMQARDRAPDIGTMGDFTLTMDPPDPAVWIHGEGPDYAAAPNLAVGAGDQVHIAYIVYNDKRDTPTGLYHARLDVELTNETSGNILLESQRVAGVTMQEDIHQGDKTTTALAVDEDGRPHILFYPSPEAAPAQIRYATHDASGWILEDPATPTDGPSVTVRDDRRAVPAIAASHGRVVAALVSGDDLVLVERSDYGWNRLQTLQDARFPNMAFDSDGTLHAAWFREDRDEYEDNRAIYGDLRYGNEADGWQGQTIAQDVEDRSRFWDTAETDGSFAFALDPQGRAHFVWEDTSEGRFYAILEADGLVTETSPLEPGHGNIQNRIRMGIDDNGTSHIMSGYGGADLYATRTTGGEWTLEQVSRVDVFDLAVLPDGRVVNTGTQPHGGQTLHLGATTGGLQGWPVTTGPPGPETQGPAIMELPAPGILLALAGVVTVLALIVPGARRLADVNPARIAPLFAFVGGFSRLNKKKVLEHVTRDAILEAVSAQPGRSAASVRTALGTPRSTFYYHLRRLEEENVLKVKRKGRELLLYHAHAPPTKTPLTEGDRVLLRTLQEVPGRTASEYARIVATQERTIRNRLRRLEELRVVERYITNPREIRWSLLHEAEIGEAS